MTRLENRFRGKDARRTGVFLAPSLSIVGLGVLAPFLLLFVMSFWTRDGLGFDTTPRLTNYIRIWEEPIFGALMWRSIWIAGVATITTVVTCYPMAYFVAFGVKRHKVFWIVILTLPFWTSYLLRIFSWKIVLGYEGIINVSLLENGWIDAPLQALLYSKTAVVIALVHAWAPFAILPIYISLERINKSVLDASIDLGDGRVSQFLRVTLPLSAPGVLVASLLIFVPTLGEYITPALLGGSDGIMIGNLIHTQFSSAHNWPMGAALSVVLALWVTVIAPLFLRLTRRAKDHLA